MNGTRPLPPSWKLEQGELWHYTGRGRERGRWAACRFCGERFPALRSRNVYCSPRCSGSGRSVSGNQEAFSTWTRAEAWLAGLIWADGSLHQRAGSLRGFVRVGSIDVEMMAHASRILGRPISEERSSRGHKTFYTVSISGLPVDRLRAVGLQRNKTFVGGLPSLEAIDNTPAFVRGFFDGDGHVGIVEKTGMPRLVSGFVGTLQCMTELQDVLVREAGVNRTKVFRLASSPVVRRLQFNHRDSLRLAEYMYGSGGPSLSRKRLRFQRGGALLPDDH